MKAGDGGFSRAFPKDAEDFAGFANTKTVDCRCFVISGEKAGGPFLIETTGQGWWRPIVEGRAGERKRTLADGRGAGSGDPESWSSSSIG